jgi:hypothetical protein
MGLYVHSEVMKMSHPWYWVVSDVHSEPMVEVLVGLREIVQQGPGSALCQQSNQPVPVCASIM